MEFLLIIIGFILLIKASSFFVDASVNIAKILKISEIIIGATIVSIGTTLPETMVSVTSAFKGHGDISFGNALGSIICNTSLIAATSLVFKPGLVNKKSLKLPILFFFSSFLVYSLFAYIFNGFDRVRGIILVSIFIIYSLCIIKSSKSEGEKIEVDKKNNDENEKFKYNSIVKSIIVIILSASIIAFASNLLVDNGTIIARKFGVPESVIGLTLIALGTSLPEFSTAITSIIKGHNDLSIGNIIGANFFNVVTVSGLAAVVGPFKVPSDKLINGINATLVVDIPLAVLVMLILCIPTVIKGKTYRLQGIVLYLLYVTFLIYQFK